MSEIEIIKEEIKNIFKDDSSGHDVEHTLRVYNTALKLAEFEQCDKRIVAIAALLHDVDDHKLFNTVDYENAKLP